MNFRTVRIKEKLFVERGDQYDIGFDPTLQAAQRRQRRFAVLGRTGECFLKCVVPRKNSGRAGDLLISLRDQLFENLRASLQARVDLGARMLPIGATDDEIGRALQKR